MALGTEVGLSPGDFVLYGDRGPRPSPKSGRRPCLIFGAYLLWTNGWMHQDGTWYGGRSKPRELCVRYGTPFPQKGGGGPSPPPPKKNRPVLIVASGQSAG